MMRLPQQAPGAGDAGFTLIPGLSPEVGSKLVLSGVLILALLMLRRGILAVVFRRSEDSVLRYKWAKVSSNVGFVIAAVALIQIWFVAITSLGTFLGLLSAGLAIALKDLIADLAGWIFITWRRPFDVGDRIQIGEYAGDVVDQRIFQFTIMEIGNTVMAEQSTGRLIHIPNASLFTQPLANYVAGFPYLWNELPVLVTFESNWKKLKGELAALAADLTVDIMREAHKPVDQAGRRFPLLRYRKLTPVVYVSVEASGVLLTLRYLCRPREKRSTGSELWERILTLLEESPDAALAYPTQRLNLAREAVVGPPVIDDGDGSEEATDSA